jgi:hypothetical protein
VLFVALACLVTACLFTGTCIVWYRIGEWKAKLATLRNFRKRTDGEKIEARLRNMSDAGRRVLDTRADGPILDRYVAAISPPPVTVSNVWWLGPNTNTILERHVGASADVERPSLPPHPDLAPAPTPGRVIVFDAASMEAVATHGATLSDTPPPCPPDTSPTPPSDR